MFKDGENVFNGTTKIKSTGLPAYKIPLKTCSNYDVTLDLLNPSNETVKLSGGLGMATLQRKLQVGPRNQTLSLQLTDEAKPRELNFYATGNSIFILSAIVNYDYLIYLVIQNVLKLRFKFSQVMSKGKFNNLSY